MSDEHIRAWHFCAGDKLRDGQEVVVGRTYSVEGNLVMCKHGLHWSRKIIDALRYAPGDTICIVEAWGDVQEQDDKGVSRYRKVIAKINGRKLLRLFACDVAEDAMKKTGVTDERSWNAIKVARLYARGRATDKQLAAAREASRREAWAAAWGAVREAAWEAAQAAAWAAARADAWVAAHVAAQAAARAAAWVAAQAAAQAAAWVAAQAAAQAAAWAAAQAAAQAAAWADTWEAAWAAAQEAQNARLTSMVLTAMKRKSIEREEEV